MKLRPNVAAIVRNAAGLVLVGQRLGTPGSWQFPQGGVDTGETHVEALERELKEELALFPENYEVLEQKGPYRYLLGGGRTKKGYHGQEQQYFLVEFSGSDSQIDVRTADPEFSAWRWIRPEEFNLEWLPSFKREVYRAVFQDFFQIELSRPEKC